MLVNDIWGGELLKQWDTPVWEHDLDAGLRLLHLAVDTHLITSHHLLPLLVDRPGGLLVEVTDGTTDYNATHYRLCAFYDLAKVAVNRLAFSQGHELAAHGGTAVAVTPGWLRSEMMLDNYQVAEDNWRDALARPPDGDLPVAPPGFALSESPRYVGPGGGRPGRRPGAGPLEPGLGHLGRARPGLRLHRPRRLPPRRLALHGRGRGGRPRGRPRRLPVALAAHAVRRTSSRRS